MKAISNKDVTSYYVKTSKKPYINSERHLQLGYFMLHKNKQETLHQPSEASPIEMLLHIKPEHARNSASSYERYFVKHTVKLGLNVLAK